MRKETRLKGSWEGGAVGAAVEFRWMRKPRCLLSLLTGWVACLIVIAPINGSQKWTTQPQVTIFLGLMAEG